MNVTTFAKVAIFSIICNHNRHIHNQNHYLCIMQDNITSLPPEIITLTNERGLFAATTCRGGTAYDTDAYSGFSLCHYSGDNETHFNKCHNQLAEWCAIEPEKIFVPRQTHSPNVTTITQENLADNRPDNCDALVTRMPGIIIGINTADCVPVLMYDRENGVIAAAHAGWRGAIEGIIKNTINAMIRLKADSASIKAIICPAICSNCFEVGEEVASLFTENRVIRHGHLRPHVDLPGYVKDCIENEGLIPQNILLTKECTRCQPMKYFSARASGIKSGRNYSFIMLRKHCDEACGDCS